MNYIIQAYENNKGLLGTENQTLVTNCKSLVKVKNALKYFNPSKFADEIRVHSYTNLYDEKTFKLILKNPYNKIN